MAPALGDSGEDDCVPCALQVVIESDLYSPRPLELLPQRCERRDTGDRRFGRLQTARPSGTHPTKTPVRPGM